MDPPSTCCYCIPIRNGVIALAVFTMLEGIGEIALIITMVTMGHCGFYHVIINNDGYHNDHDVGYYDDGYHIDNNSYYNHNSYNGYHNDIDDYNNPHNSYNGYHYDIDDIRDLASSCYSSFEVAGIWLLVAGSVSCISALCLLIGVKKMIPNLLIPFVLFMGVNGAAYLVLGILVLNGAFTLFPFVVGIWIVCWSLLAIYFVFVVYFYRKNMIRQLMNRELGIAAYPPVAVMPGIPGFHTVIPYVTYPPVMTVHAGKPGRGITTKLQPGSYIQPPGIYAKPGIFAQPGTYAQPGIYDQPGIYAQPGTYAQSGAYGNLSFYSDAGIYVHPQLGAHPHPGACPFSGNPTQPGILPENGTSPRTNDQPPPFTHNRKGIV